MLIISSWPLSFQKHFEVPRKLKDKPNISATTSLVFWGNIEIPLRGRKHNLLLDACVLKVWEVVKNVACILHLFRDYILRLPWVSVKGHPFLLCWSPLIGRSLFSELRLPSLSALFFIYTSQLLKERTGRSLLSLAFWWNVLMNACVCVHTKAWKPSLIVSVLFSWILNFKWSSHPRFVGWSSRPLCFSASMYSWCSIIAFVSQVQDKRASKDRGLDYIHDMRFGWQSRG